MLIRIVLIIFSFFYLCRCCSHFTNISKNEESKLCPFNLFRSKRAIDDYTRWRGGIESTSEFIVKVFDEDISTSKSKKIAAINIQPITRGKENIVKGGIGVSPTTEEINPVTIPNNEYTRFIPPTTLTATRTKDLDPMPIRTSKSFVKDYDPIVPVHHGPIKIPKINLLKLHSRRDERFPTSSQFVSKLTKMPLQYAPLSQVVFSKSESIVTPPDEEFIQPTRTLPYAVPIRTSLQGPEYNFPFFPGTRTFEDSPTRTSLLDIPTITTLKSTEENTISDYDKDIAKKQFIKDSLYSDKDKVILDKIIEKDMDYNQEYSFDNEVLLENETDIKDSEYFYEETGSETDKKQVNDSTDKSHPTLTELKISTLSFKQNIPTWETTTKAAIYDNFDDESLRKSPKRIFSSTRIEEEINASKYKENNFCSLLKLRPINFHSPRTLYEIRTQLKNWAEESPLAKLIDVTDGNLTTMENPIYMMVVDDPSSGQILSAKQTVMIVAGIQGRDHHAVTSAIYLLYQLIERSEANTDLLSKYRFWVIPVFNPDGYDYSITFPHHRNWTKNLRQNWDLCKGRAFCKACENYGLRCTIQSCYGVSLDRNFEYQWIPPEDLRSEHPCGDLYAGVRQLSEPETRALTTYLHEKWSPINTFIALKEGDILGVMYPYSHTKKRRTLDHVYRQRASRAAAAAYSISGRQYVAGQTSEFLPLFAGGIEDWIDGHLGVDHTYTIMMYRPTDNFNSKFATETIVHETYAATDTLLMQVAEVEMLTPPTLKLVSKKSNKLHPVSLFQTIFTLLCLIILSD